MFTNPTTLLASALVSASTAMAASDLLWDGRFNSSTAADISAWSFSNPVGAYQYYIHGSGNQSEYVNIDPAYKNPADTSSSDGVKITIDDTSYWNGQTMRRTELIPETEAAINKGKVYYHFSIQHTATNPPSQGEEHQIAFFESHFTELKSGPLVSGQKSNALMWMVGGVSQWNISDWTADVWHNVAYGIDFDGQTVEFYHSTGADDLKLIAGPVAATASSDGADWHLGVLRIAPQVSTDDTGAEDFYFSGVYIESGDVTLSVAGPGAAAGAGSSASASSSAVVSSTAAATTSSAAATAASSSSSAPATSSAPASTSVAASSSSAAPATLPTIVKASSSSSVAATTSVASTSSSAAPTTTSSGDEGNCEVEYVYV